MKRRPKIKIDYTDWTIDQHEAHLRTHEAYTAVYPLYDPSTVDEFIKSYAKEKYDWYKHKEMYEETYEKYYTQFLTRAEEYFDMILQKKLFNLQCQWRAGLIRLPFVDICDDFKHWEQHIRSCPFIEPVTQDEIDLCIRFLLEEIDFFSDVDYSSMNWQCYEKFKNQILVEDFDNNLNMKEEDIHLPEPYQCAPLPDIYEFFDTYQATSALISLPDVRGNQEKIYYDEGYRLKKEKEEAELKAKGEYKEPVAYTFDEIKPFLYSWNDEIIQDIVEQAEDEETKEIYEHFQVYDNSYSYLFADTLTAEYINFLNLFENEDIPIEACDDWEEAIEMTARKFKQKKIAEMIPYAYDSYLLEFDEADTVEKIIAGRIAHYKYVPKETMDTYKLNLMTKQYILDGREALEGRRDFDY